QLQQRSATHPVDEADRAVAGEVEIGEDRIDEHPCDLVRAGHRYALPAGFAVDPDADLQFILGQLERRFPGGRHGARGEGDAYAAAVRVDPAGHVGHLVEVPALFGGGPGDLLQQDGHTDPAPPGGVEAVLNGDVVVGHHRHDPDARLGLGHLGGHLEVHDVAGVVLHDVQDTGPAVDGLRGGDHLVRHRRGEHFTRTRGVEHALTDEAAVQGLVAGTAAGDQPHLAADRRVPAIDDLVGVVDA